MNAVLPDDLSHYERARPSTPVERDDAHGALEEAENASWEDPDSSGLDSSPGMTWVGPEPLF